MSTVPKLKLLKKIPQSVKDCVYGYSHKFERSLKCTIPLLIQSLFLLYFYETDYFQSASDCYQISDDKMQVTVIDDTSYAKYGRVMIFCNEWIQSISKKIVKWAFYINEASTDGEISYDSDPVYSMVPITTAFVLISKDKGFGYDYWYNKDKDHYRYAHINDGNHLANGVTKINLWMKVDPNKPERPRGRERGESKAEYNAKMIHIRKKYHDDLKEYYQSENYRKYEEKVKQWEIQKDTSYKKFVTGDTVLYTLDLMERVFKCKINDQKEWIVSKVEVSDDIRYKLALSTTKMGNQITLTDFSWSFT